MQGEKNCGKLLSKEIFNCPNCGAPAHHKADSKINTQFMLSAVKCKGCGASFDATHQKECPHCGREYNLEKDDWVVDNIQKI